ncbi:MAG TPA: hypothetical protein VHN37_03200 [Actinomycetota bacterium]|nr:hypothetical protein [Actinomycetota bacterium]
MDGRRIAPALALTLLSVPPATSAAEASAVCLGRAATIVGTGGDDRLVGTSGPDVLVGLGGRDQIIGSRGDDVVCGGPGDDTIVGDRGDDVLSGGHGSDALVGSRGADTLRGDAGDDELVAQRARPDAGDSARGGPGDDVCANASSGAACETTRTRMTSRTADALVVAGGRATIDAATGAGDVNGDGEVDLVVGSARAARSAGVVTVLLGSLSVWGAVDLRDPPGAVQIRGAQDAGEDPNDAGLPGNRAHLVSAGDVNGDGLDDVVVGAPGADGDTEEDAGRVYVVFGSSDPEDVDLATFDANAQGDAGFRITGPGGGDGMSIAFLGDVNRDGLGDVAVGWRFGDTYVVFGKADGGPVDLRLFDLGLQGDAGYRIATASDGNHYDVAPAGDFDGDGLDDVVLLRSRWFEEAGDPFGSERTETWIVYGKADSATVDQTALERTGTRVAWGFEERRAAGVGDLDGDGLDDVAFTNTPSFGTARVLFGSDGLRGLALRSAFRSRFVIDAWFGLSSWGEGPPVPVGDTNADGRPDFAFTSVSAASRPARGLYRRRDLVGSAFTVFGSGRTRRTSAYALERGGRRYVGPRPDCPRSCPDYLYRPEVSRLGDVNGDGAADLFVYTASGDRGFVVVSRGWR